MNNQNQTLSDKDIKERYGELSDEEKQIVKLQNSDDNDIDIEETEIVSPPIKEDMPKDRTLYTEQFRVTIKELINMIEEELLYLTPEYQRQAGIWDLKRKSQLIESLLLSIPIPTIYCMETEKEDSDSVVKTVWEIIDGLQRISTIEQFYKNKFKLKNLEELRDLEGLSYQELSEKHPKAKYMIDRSVLPIVLIKKNSDDSLKFDVFARLNTGAVKLNNQELRNCIYRGSFNELLRELRENSVFLRMIFSKGQVNKRMIDIEIILRFFAVYHNLNKTINKDKVPYSESNKDIIHGYIGSIKPFLNSFMKNNKDEPQEWIEENKQLFTNTISLVNDVFGKNAFRRGDTKKVLNLSIYDIVMSSFAIFDTNLIIEKKDTIQSEMTELLKSDEMNMLISTGTNSKETTNKRFILWFNKLWDILYG